MKKLILKFLRQNFVKQKKEIPLGVEAAGLDMKAEKIAKELSDAGYRGPINLDFIKRIDQAMTPTFERVVPKTSGEVFDLTGKKIDTSKPISGGKNVPETEAEIAARLTKQNKETVERLKNKEGPIDWDEVDKIDPEDFAGGGIAGMLGETDRVPYKDGKNGFSGTFDEWRKQNPSREELLSQDPSKNIGDYIKPIPQFDERGNLIPIFSKTGKQQIEGLPEGITSDKEVFNLIIGLDIPITERIKILGDIGFSKFRDKVEKGDKELGLYDQPGNVDKNIGIGYDDNGLSGSFMYNPDTKSKDFRFKISKKFNKGGLAPLLGEPTYADGGRTGFQEGALAAFQQGQNIIGAPTAPYDVSAYEGKYDPGTIDFLRRNQVPTSAPEWFLKEQEMQKQHWDPSWGAFESESWEEMEDPAKIHMMRELGPYHELEYANPNALADPMMPPVGPAGMMGPGMMPPVGPVGMAGPSMDPNRIAEIRAQQTAAGVPLEGQIDPTTGLPPGGPVGLQEPVTRNPLVDPRMYRSYEENIRLMGDPRMRGAKGGRIGFKLGGIDKARRLFLQAIGAGTAGVTAAKSGLFGLLKGGGKKQVVETLTSVPIKNIDGMPAWFKPLVNKVIKEGEDVTTKFATAERQIVHKTNLPHSDTDVIVTQNLDSGNVSVDIGIAKHDFKAGHLGQPARLNYKAAEVIEPTTAYTTKNINKKTGKLYHKGGKTKEEFWVEEAEFTGGHPENIKFEESTFNKFGQHGSDFSEVEKFATGKIKKKTAKESIKAERAHWTPEGDYASGGRVPLDEGGITSRVPYWKGGSWKAIKEAIKHNKIFGVGGPPYKPGATSFDIKQLTKDRFGTELSLKELKEMISEPNIIPGISPRQFKEAKETLPKFLGGFKEYKAEVIKAQLLESKQKAEIGIKVAKDILSKPLPEGLDPAMANKMYKQMIKQDTQRLKDIKEALKDIDVYKAMKEKTGITSHATGGRVPLRGGKGVLKGLAKLMDEFFPGTTKVGKTSKPMAEKTQLRKAIADFQNREKHKTLLDDFNKKYTVEQETKISSEQVGSLDEFHADFVKETGINVPKENLKGAWDMKKSYPFNTPIIDKNGKVLGGEATQQMYPKSKKFIVSDEDKLTKEINLKREGRRPSGERAGVDVPPVPAGFKLSREKLIENFPEIGLDEIDEVMKLDRKTQARYIMMLKNRRLDPDLYDELLLKHGDTLDFQGEFDKAVRRKKNATGGRVSLSSGGLAGMLGE